MSPVHVDTGFDKGGSALMQHCQINGFWLEFYIIKNNQIGVKFGLSYTLLRDIKFG